MIGQKIAEGLDHLYEAISLPDKAICWNTPASLIEQFDTVIKKKKPKIVDIIWCAGKSRFNANEIEVEKEILFFEAVVNALNAYDTDLRFSLLSSAGGAYENAHFVKDINEISPARPYAFGKLKQEKSLIAAGVTTRIYRLSSVYGYKHNNPRLGLINTMIANALSGDPIKVFGRQTTFRDYISQISVLKLYMWRLLIMPMTLFLTIMLFLPIYKLPV